MPPPYTTRASAVYRWYIKPKRDKKLFLACCQICNRSRLDTYLLYPVPGGMLAVLVISRPTPPDSSSEMDDLLVLLFLFCVQDACGVSKRSVTKSWACALEQ